MNNTKRSKYLEFFKGDKILWGIVILISIASLFLVYSASSNLEYLVNNGTTTGHLLKHGMFIFLGLGIMRGIGMIKYEHIGKVSGILLVLTIGLLIITMIAGLASGNTSAARWLSIPGIGVSFQPSSLAYLFLIIYICRYLTKNINRKRTPIEDILYVFVPILAVFFLVVKDNGSTGIIILLVSMIVLVVGQYKFKYILGFLAVATVSITLFLLLALNTSVFGDNHRVNTWKSRIETFMVSPEDAESIESEELKAKTYQVMLAKAAIVHGGITGKGPGKSALKQTLPQSASDFIFAIIVEEYGLIGATILIFFYFIMLIRIVTIANKMPTFFGSLLVISIGIMLFVQLAINIAVALNLMPVTGQPLPLISYGGTSMLVTYIQLGLVLNISSRIQIYDEEGIGKSNQKINEINDIA